MSVIVTDTGFAEDDWTGSYGTLEDGHTRGIDLPSDTDPAAMAALPDGTEMVRIAFPSSADGRGFTLARLLRLRGYRGRLRAKGHVIADQYTMARRCGFDEVEIDDALAERQPEDQWLFRANWQAHDYQTRVRG